MKKYLKVSILIFSLFTIFFFVQNKYNKKTSLVFQENNSKKYVALTFDDGPHPKYTDMLLDGLKERNVKATFFVIGKNAQNNYNVLKRMIDEGHIIGNHTYSHKNLFLLNEKQILKEIDQTNQIIEAVSLKPVKYFRPSYGNYNAKIINLAQMEVVLWNVDSLDWKIRNSNRIARKVVNKVQNGSIILMHDIYKTSVKAAFKIIDELQKEGYEFVTIDKLLETSLEY